ncbi:MAG: MarR family transcriptional regulator [Candidatus Kapaibacterium sp.]
METKRSYGQEADSALNMWVKLARAFSVFNRLSTKDIATYGLTQPQFAVLETLGHLGPMSVGKLCEKMLVSGGNMTVVLDNLQREGLIERIRSLADRRSTMIRLTNKGETLFTEIFPQHAIFIETIARVLSPEEQLELAKLLKKLGLLLDENPQR